MEKSYKIGLFAYNFPHKKTRDFIFQLLSEGYEITAILAADPVKLNIPPSVIKTKIRHQGLLHPASIAKRFNIPYHVVKHNSEAAVALTRKYGLNIGIIAGARILKPIIIREFSIGIINYHPGLVPEARGLDAMLWSIHENIPLGITSHIINEEVDGGKILQVLQIPIYKDDTIFDLSERLYEYQLDMIKPSIEAAAEGKGVLLDTGLPYNKKMPAELELGVLGKVEAYVAAHSSEEKVIFHGSRKSI